MLAAALNPARQAAARISMRAGVASRLPLPSAVASRMMAPGASRLLCSNPHRSFQTTPRPQIVAACPQRLLATGILGRSSVVSLKVLPISALPKVRAMSTATAAAGGTAEGAKKENELEIESVEQQEETTGSERAIGWWLIGCSAIVVVILSLGGLTRLTGSGLSMVKWKPQGTRLPTTKEEWESEFEDYKKHPEYIYKRQYEDFGMDEFKFIYFMEWFHRMAGRSVGVAFLLPLAYFAARGVIPKAIYGRLAFLTAVGSSQGLVGWWMVRSGLNSNMPKKDDEEGEEWQYNTQFAAVSPYRLAFHLSTAITLQLVLLTTGLAMLDKGRLLARSPAAQQQLTWLWRHAHTAASFGGLAAFSGGFVAGNRAGLCCNDWPLMDGQVIPEGLWEDRLGWKNLFENQITVQFDHRSFAYLMLGFTAATWNSARKLPLPPRVKTALNAVLLCCAGQVSMGVLTLWFHVPIEIAAPHQLGSVVTLSAFVWFLHTIRMVVPGARFIPVPPIK